MAAPSTWGSKTSEDPTKPTDETNKNVVWGASSTPTTWQVPKASDDDKNANPSSVWGAPKSKTTTASDQAGDDKNPSSSSTSADGKPVRPWPAPNPNSTATWPAGPIVSKQPDPWGIGRNIVTKDSSTPWTTSNAIAKDPKEAFDAAKQEITSAAATATTSDSTEKKS